MFTVLQIDHVELFVPDQVPRRRGGTSACSDCGLFPSARDGRGTVDH